MVGMETGITLIPKRSRSSASFVMTLMNGSGRFPICATRSVRIVLTIMLARRKVSKPFLNCSDCVGQLTM